MAQPAHSYVQYFIPYDGDNEEHPNVYLVKKPQKDLRLADLQQVRACSWPLCNAHGARTDLRRVLQAFPLPGQYFFRVKTSFGKTHGELRRPAKEHLQTATVRDAPLTYIALLCSVARLE